MAMSQRENLISLFRKQGVERIPVHFSLCPHLLEIFRKKTNSEHNYDVYFDFPWRSVEGPRLKDGESVDWSVYFKEPLKPGTTFTVYGVGFEPGDEACFHLKRFKHPMVWFDSLEQFQQYPYPDYTSASADHMVGRVKKIHDMGYAAHGGMACTVWETSWYMRGMEQLMMDMSMEDEKAVYHLDRITDLSCIRARAFARAGVDVLSLGDDVGMQKTLLMSRQMYCDWLKPRLTKVIDAAREEKPDIIITYHSCGYVIPLIEDLIEAGIDVLNPVQPECMDFAEVHDRFSDRLSFWGTIGTQTTMPFGSAEEVRKTVIRNLDIAGEKGGLLPSPTHLLEPEVPWENVEAYVEACREYGQEVR